MSSPPWSPTRERHGHYEELAQVDEYGTIRPASFADDLSDQASDDALVHHEEGRGNGEKRYCRARLGGIREASGRHPRGI